MKRWVAIGGIVVGMGLVGYALFARDTDQELIRARLDQLTMAVRLDKGEDALARGARVRRALDEVLTRNVVVRIADLPTPGQGRAGLFGLAMQAGQRYQTAHVELSHTSIRLDTHKTTASVQSDATLTATDSGGLHQQHRHASFRFTRGSDGWRISSIEVSAPPDPPTEARP